MKNDRETSEKKAPEPLLVDSEERLDWDAYIPPPPPKRKGVIRVRLVYKKSEPLPLLDPDEE